MIERKSFLATCFRDQEKVSSDEVPLLNSF
jgi:hypothetical protein